jgi:hypothetical protein
VPPYTTKSKRSSAASKGVPVDELELDARCQARSEIRPEIVDEYAALYAAEVKLPPISVFDVNGKMFIVDGIHRFSAAVKAGVEFIRCTVVGKGTVEDAAWHATGVNQVHGIRRSNADKRRAVQLALESDIGSEQSSTTIAEHVGVSADFVSRVRKEVEGPSAPERVRAKDGRMMPRRTNRAPSSDDGGAPKPAKSHDTENEKSPARTPATPMPEEGELYRKAAAAVQRARGQVSELIEDQTAEKALEAAWRRLDDMSTVVCAPCKGAGCKWCDDNGWSTKRDARAAKEKRRSLKIARGRS